MSKVRTALVIGGGVAGPVAALALRKAGIDATVYEAYPRTADGIGGSLAIAPNGLAALEIVGARKAVEDIGMPIPETVMSFGDKEVELPQLSGLPPMRLVQRGDLHRALYDVAVVGGVRVEHGRRLVSYDDGPGGVTARFADGAEATADVLVGADGVGSRVRAGLLPDFEVVDIGVRCVYGKLPLTDAVRAEVPPAFLRGFCFASDGTGRGAGFAPVLFRERPEEYGDYLMVVFTGTPQVLGHSDEELFALTPEALWQVVVEGTAGWHPAIREVVAAADAAAAFPITLRSCTRIDPWPTGRVTLLGDAVHPMTPAAGAGANTALHDAALLTAALRDRGVDGLAEYEREMIGHARGVVADSRRRAEQMFGPARTE